MSPSADKTNQKVAESVETATQIAAGGQTLTDFRQLKKLVKDLKGRQEFRLATKLLEIASKWEWHNQNSVWIVQQLALCTYKDEELLPAVRFARSIELLKTIGLGVGGVVDPVKIDPLTLPETLGLRGAVYKRKWEYRGQIEDLQQALVFYQAAWNNNEKMDMGYGGVNAAFVLDVLASRAKVIALRAGSNDSPESQRLRLEARNLREAMAAALPKLAEERAKGDYPNIQEEYWYLVTMAEICFGLSDYKAAGEWLARARNAGREDFGPATDWQVQTTFRQLVTLAKQQGLNLLEEGAAGSPTQQAHAAIHELMGAGTGYDLSCYRGRAGLALSGGGLRASLFHLGVLARLAEADVLRSVEVFSTVSGGSIAGAHYYLKVRQELQSKPDSEITRQNYIRIVSELIDEFMAGVSRNLRTRALTNLMANIKMIVFETYSDSHRMGELYEDHLYARVKDGHPSGQPRRLEGLVVAPAVRRGGADLQNDNQFKPKFSNWTRAAKVPVLLLNSTALNSGHSWQFPATWMGEPPGLVGQEVDVNPRYRRLYYQQAPTQALRDYRLGYAVAASACVPALFQPLVLDELYPRRTVRLGGGGVHGNHVVGRPLHEGRTVVFCRASSTQMEDAEKPPDNLVGVALRASNILQSRVRDAGYQDMKGRVDSHSLQGLFFIHMKKGLEALPLDWTDCDDPALPPMHPEAVTPYGVDKDLQRKLAAIRTDLDSFSEVEAFSLMLSGYLMTEYELKALDAQHRADQEPGTWGGFDVNAPRGSWRFLELKDLIRRGADDSDARRKDLGKQLKTAASGAFKIWQLSPMLRGAAVALGLGVVVALGWWLCVSWNNPISFGPYDFLFKHLVGIVVLGIATIVVPALKWINPMKAMRGYVWKAVVAVLGFLVANLHILLFDWMFLRRGRLNRLMRLK